LLQADKIFRGDEIKTRLLEYLQEKRGNREKIATHFNLCEDAINSHISEFQKPDGDNIPGGKVKIDPQSGTNDYDFAIHPVLLTLNLSEVITLTVGLKNLTKSNIFNEVADDIYRQLTEYDKRIIKSRADTAGVKFGESEFVL
jgi:hypothetical protein